MSQILNLQDSSAVWAAAQKSTNSKTPKVIYPNVMIQIEFEEQEFRHVGCQYSFRVGEKESTFFLLHPSTMRSISEAHGKFSFRAFLPQIILFTL